MVCDFILWKFHSNGFIVISGKRPIGKLPNITKIYPYSHEAKTIAFYVTSDVHLPDQAAE